MNCPRCNAKIEKGMHALSRQDNKTKICSNCGIVEAFKDFKPIVEVEIVK